jgi:chromosome segregation ATPase
MLLARLTTFLYSYHKTSAMKSRSREERGTYAPMSEAVNNTYGIQGFQDRALNAQMTHNEKQIEANLNEEMTLEKEIKVVEDRVVQLEQQYRHYQQEEKATLADINNAMLKLQALKQREKQEGRETANIEAAQARAKARLTDMLKRQQEQNRMARKVLNEAQSTITEGEIEATGADAQEGALSVERTQLGEGGGNAMASPAPAPPPKRRRTRAANAMRQSVAAPKDVYDTGIKQMQFLRTMKQSV